MNDEKQDQRQSGKIIRALDDLIRDLGFLLDLRSGMKYFYVLLNDHCGY